VFCTRKCAEEYHSKVLDSEIIASISIPKTIKEIATMFEIEESTARRRLVRLVKEKKINVKYIDQKHRLFGFFEIKKIGKYY